MCRRKTPDWLTRHLIPRVTAGTRNRRSQIGHSVALAIAVSPLPGRLGIPVSPQSPARLSCFPLQTGQQGISNMFFVRPCRPGGNELFADIFAAAFSLAK